MPTTASPALSGSSSCWRGSRQSCGAHRSHRVQLVGFQFGGSSNQLSARGGHEERLHTRALGARDPAPGTLHRASQHDADARRTDQRGYRPRLDTVHPDRIEESARGTATPEVQAEPATTATRGHRPRDRMYHSQFDRIPTPTGTSFFVPRFFELPSRSRILCRSEGRRGEVTLRADFGRTIQVALLPWRRPGSQARRAAAVSQAELIASISAEQASVSQTVRPHPDRFVDFLPCSIPRHRRVGEKLEHIFAGLRLRCVWLFTRIRPATDSTTPRSRQSSRTKHARGLGGASFAAALLSVDIRRKLGLPSPPRSAPRRIPRFALDEYHHRLWDRSGHRSTARHRTLPPGGDRTGPSLRSASTRPARTDRSRSPLQRLTFDTLLQQTLSSSSDSDIYSSALIRRRAASLSQAHAGVPSYTHSKSRWCQTTRIADLILAGNWNQLFITEDATWPPRHPPHDRRHHLHAHHDRPFLGRQDDGGRAPATARTTSTSHHHKQPGSDAA